MLCVSAAPANRNSHVSVRSSDRFSERLELTVQLCFLLLRLTLQVVDVSHLLEQLASDSRQLRLGVLEPTD